MSDQTLHLELENIGGIEELEATISDDVTFIQGPNAANKSSFLKGLLFALGTTSVPIRSGASEASAVLSFGNREVERVARRTDNGVETAGEVWITDPDEVVLLERFAALLETNSLRSAVAYTDEIESLLKGPMDIESLEAERSEKMSRKRELTTAVESAADIEDQLVNRKRELEEKRERVETLEEKLEELYDKQDETVSEDDVLEELRAERADLRTDESERVSQIEQLESAIVQFENKKAEIDDDLQVAHEDVKENNLESLKNQRESIRSELEDITRRLDVLQSVLTANREMLESEFTGALGYESGLMDDTVTCWACGQSASTEAFEETLEKLTELVTEDKQSKHEYEPEINTLTEQIESVRESEAEVRRLEGEKQDVEQKLNTRRDSLEERREQLQAIRERLREIDDKIADREADHVSEQSDLTDEIEEVRVEIQMHRREIERLEDTVETLRQERAERERKREEIEELSAEITQLTDRIENLESELREVFNGTMDDLLDVLEFERIERVWLDGEFDLVIVREVDGQSQTDSLEHLAESEREMIGLVLALAGFVTYDVNEVTPVLVLDSLGAFDAERTRRLVEYFAGETDYLLATAHPEFGADNQFETITFEQSHEGGVHLNLD